MHKCPTCGSPAPRSQETEPNFGAEPSELDLDEESAAKDEVLAELERLLEGKAASRLPRRPEDEIV